MTRSRLKAGEERLRILDFDCECRPLAWYAGDLVTKQPTAIAWRWIGERSPVEVVAIGESCDTRYTLAEEEDMLEAFHEQYLLADMVTGHYIRGFDLPLLSGARMRLGLSRIGDKLAQDTKLDLVRAGGLSKSMENLGAMFELRHPKLPMNTAQWAESNMLLPRGIENAKRRVVADVREHVELRAVLVDRDLLMAPKTWRAAARRNDGGYLP